MRKTEENNIDLDSLPSLPTKESDKLAVQYVQMVYEGYSKQEAYKAVFPERYQKLKDKCEQYKRSFKVTLTNYICRYEDGKYVSSLYAMGAEQYYKQFIDKRTKLLNKLYDIAMDDEEKMSNRLVASKTFLGSIPEPKKEVVHKVEVDVKDEFRRKLEEKQSQLYNVANKEDIEEAIIVNES
jgi:hypothetical protein